MNCKQVVVGVLLLAVAGCSPVVSRTDSGGSGKTARASRKKTGGRSTSATSKPAKRPSVAPDAFLNIDEAVETLVSAADSRDSKRRLEASDWLAMQGAPAIPRLSSVLEDEQAGTAPRIAACRVLGRLGPPALEPLIGQLNCSDQMVRINAVDQLPHIDPCVPQVVETLIKTLDHEDDRMRQRAVKGLTRLGSKAQAAAPRLLQILSSSDNDQLRNDAKQALKSVDPRRTLTFD